MFVQFAENSWRVCVLASRQLRLANRCARENLRKVRRLDASRKKCPDPFECSSVYSSSDHLLPPKKAPGSSFKSHLHSPPAIRHNGKSLPLSDALQPPIGFMSATPTNRPGSRPPSRASDLSFLSSTAFWSSG